MPHSHAETLHIGAKAETDLYWFGRWRKLIRAPWPPILCLEDEQHSDNECYFSIPGVIDTRKYRSVEDRRWSSWRSIDRTHRSHRKTCGSFSTICSPSHRHSIQQTRRNTIAHCHLRSCNLLLLKHPKQCSKNKVSVSPLRGLVSGLATINPYSAAKRCTPDLVIKFCSVQVKPRQSIIAIRNPIDSVTNRKERSAVVLVPSGPWPEHKHRTSSYIPPWH